MLKTSGWAFSISSKQHDRVRPAADLLGELAALLVADVTRRSADQPADVVLLHVLAHVDLHEGLFVAEHEFGERLGQQRLADARGTGEEKHARGPLRDLQSAAAAADGLGDLLDRLVLADDPLVQLVFHLQEPCGSSSLDSRVSGTPVILRDDLRDHFVIDDAVGLAGLVAPLAGERFLLLLELVGLIAKAGRLLEVLVGDRFFLGDVEPLDLLFEFLQIRRADHRLEPDAGTRLVDHVDRLVRQAAARDVTVRQLDGPCKASSVILHAVVRLVAVAESLEDLDRLVPARRLDDHGLEAALEAPSFSMYLRYSSSVVAPMH